ncbi:VOC family protein [Nocardioides sp.]|uniref:VOC family protein n=1 Tax=Nocardioides sp. TaxID=35761 RepID=UPI003568543D
MALRWYSVVVDCQDFAMLGRWWAETLGWLIAYEDDDELVIVPSHMADEEPLDANAWLEAGVGMVFGSVPERKAGKNRLHLDLAPHTTDDRDAEIERLLERGATYADVGQSEDVPWTVLLDPEGNEFCVLSARDK